MKIKKMMNSYEIEQPLDLRLKALNLSLNPFHHSTSSITSDSSTSNDSIKSIGSSGSGIQTTNAAYLVGPPAHHQAHQMSTQYHSHQLMNAHHHHYHQQQHHPTSLPLSITSQPLQTINQGQQQSHCQEPPLRASTVAPTAPQQQHNNHLRSANIHCQPLNHHHPHPLSRLHPIPSHLHSVPSQTQQSQQQQQPLASQQPQVTAPAVASAHQQPPAVVSHHYNPPRQFSSPQHHFYNYPIPVRSLSMSNYNQQHCPSSATLFSPQTNGASTSATALNKQSPSQINHSENNIFKQTSDTTSLNRSSFLKELAANTPTIQFNNKTSASSSPPATSSNSSPTNSSLLLVNSSTGSGCNSSTQTVNENNNSNSAPQITRQNSLVSRYTCEPCQIAFSQLENLRAHQKGYCTKRDRTQTPQMRSQSAVSPVSVNHQQQIQLTQPLPPPAQPATQS